MELGNGELNNENLNDSRQSGYNYQSYWNV